MAKKGRIEKKPYGSPKITKVSLKSEEAVLSGCKVSNNTSGPVQNEGGNCKYHGSNCFDLLS